VVGISKVEKARLAKLALRRERYAQAKLDKEKADRAEARALAKAKRERADRKAIRDAAKAKADRKAVRDATKAKRERADRKALRDAEKAAAALAEKRSANALKGWITRKTNIALKERVPLALAALDEARDGATLEELQRQNKNLEKIQQILLENVYQSTVAEMHGEVIIGSQEAYIIRELIIARVNGMFDERMLELAEELDMSVQEIYTVYLGS
jgi:urease gamma subunit